MTDQEFLDSLGDDLEAIIFYAKELIKLNEDLIKINEKVMEWLKKNPDFKPQDYDLIKKRIALKYFIGLNKNVPVYRRRLKKAKKKD